MTLLHINYMSRCLMGNTDVNIILPNCGANEPEEFYKSGKKYKVIWLLHGTFGDYTDWIRMTNIERYACDKNIAVVMPSSLNSMYVNWHTFAMGYNAYDNLLKELMPLVYGWFPISDKREDNFIAGLSMGGRGACVYAFNHPELFSKLYSMSAVPEDLSQVDTSSPFYPRVKNLIDNFGGMEGYLASELNLWRLVKEKKEELPELYFSCGTKDPIAYQNYLKFQEYAKTLELPVTFKTVEGYSHEWAFWDMCIQDAIEHFTE